MIFGRTQLAIQTPFEPLRNPGYGGVASPITSVEAQSAIEEAYRRAIDYALNFSRFVSPCGFDGNATAGRWLGFFQNTASNQTPLTLPKAGKISELTLSTNGNSTSTHTLFKNGVSTGVTISTTGNSRATATGLNITFVANDYLSVQTTSGSCNKPIVYIWGTFT